MDLVSSGTPLYAKPAFSFSGHQEWVWSVAFAPATGLLYSASQDRHIYAWNPKTGQPVLQLPVAPGPVVAIAISNSWLYFGCEQKIFAVNVTNGQTYDAAPAIGPLVLSILVDGDVVYGGYSDGVIRMWSQGAPKGELRQHTGPVKVLFKEAHALFSGSEDQSVVRFNTNTGRATVLYQGFSGPVRALLVFQNSIYFSDANNVRAQSIETGKCLHTMTGHKEPVFALHREGDILFSASADTVVIVRNIINAQPLFVLSSHQAVVKCLAFGNGFLWTGSSDKTVKQWDLRDAFMATNQPAPSFLQGPGPGSGVGSSPSSANGTPVTNRRDTGGYGAVPRPQSTTPMTGGYGAVPSPGAGSSGSLSQSDGGGGGYGAIPQGLQQQKGAPSAAYGGIPSSVYSSALSLPGTQNSLSSAYGAVPVLGGAAGGSSYGALPTGASGSGTGPLADPNRVVHAPGYEKIPVGQQRKGSNAPPTSSQAEYTQIPQKVDQTQANDTYQAIDPRYKK